MTPATPKLTASEKEARRKLAIRKVLAGRTQADVADFLGVHPVTVAKWMRAHRAGGDAAVTAKSMPDRHHINIQYYLRISMFLEIQNLTNKPV